LPGVCERDACLLEVASVAGREHRVVRTADGRDLPIEAIDRIAGSFTAGHQIGVFVCGGRIERQYLLRKGTETSSAARKSSSLRRPAGTRAIPERISAIVTAVV
jgi:hypothetical protein